MQEKRERQFESTYFLYLLLVVLPANMLDVPAVPLRNFAGRFLRLLVFRLFDLLGRVHSLGHSDDAHGAISIGDHYLGFRVDVLVEITRIDRQVEILLTTHVVACAALIIRHAHAVVGRGVEAAVGTVVELIIAISRKLIVRDEVSGSAELFAIRLLVSRITIGVIFSGERRRRGETRRIAVRRGRLDLERFLVVVETVERGTVRSAVSITAKSVAAEHGSHDADGRTAISVMIMMMNVLLSARRTYWMQDHLFLVYELILVIGINVLLVNGLGGEWRWQARFLVDRQAGIRSDEARRGFRVRSRCGINAGPEWGTDARWQRNGFRRAVGSIHGDSRQRITHRPDCHRLCIDNIVRMNVAMRRVERASSLHVIALKKLIHYYVNLLHML